MTPRRALSKLRGISALLLVAAAFAWSIAAIATRRVVEAPPQSIVLRIAHWQLEAGVRQAFDELAADYRREINPRFYLIQDVIPETTYGQWVSTQLMGATAPDIIEKGKGLSDAIWLSFSNRYFLPISRDVSQPNPYNKGTDLAAIPMRQTYVDGMRQGYEDQLQEYTTVPLSQFVIRLFYNRPLLKRLTGLDTAPTNYRDFLAVCEKIASRHDERGNSYTPIASSSWHLQITWEPTMLDAPTYPALRKVDLGRDGYASNEEDYVAFRAGLVHLSDPPFKARFDMLRDINRFFPPGYIGLGRDEAVFLFAQQKAVFMPTGTWDARSLQEQAKGMFEVGVMDFPVPSADDPQYGPLIEGPLVDKPMVAIGMAVNRRSRHPEVAIDFLKYLASKRGNQRFNELAGWIPVIQGATRSAGLEGFDPHVRGVYGSMSLNIGGESSIKFNQLYGLFQVGQISFDSFANQFESFYRDRGFHDFQEFMGDQERAMVSSENFLAGIRAKAMQSSGDESQSNWLRYRTLIFNRQIGPEITRAREMRLIEKGMEGRNGPYEYSKLALENIRNHSPSPGTPAFGSEVQARRGEGRGGGHPTEAR
ncbi:MAG TPA: extracellular solute-binding protein [Tepidisphaeraceae bacterium]|jgi:raffinose/stachyose/melibiose transport system substrate-binding protein